MSEDKAHEQVLGKVHGAQYNTKKMGEESPLSSQNANGTMPGAENENKILTWREKRLRMPIQEGSRCKTVSNSLTGTGANTRHFFDELH